MSPRCAARLGLPLLLGLACGPGGPPEPGAAAPPPEPPATIALAPEGLAAAGVIVVPLAPAAIADEDSAWGVVLDPLPLAEDVSARHATEVGLDAARREYERTRRLSRDRENASARELEAAETAFRRARLDHALAAARVAARWGDALAARPDLEALADRLATHAIALARLDLPPPAGSEAGDACAASGAAGAATATPVRVELGPASGATPLRGAELIGPAPAVEATLQGRSYLAFVREDPPVPGTALVARLAGARPPRPGVLLPQAAVLWSDGSAVVYAAAGEGRFERRPVCLVTRRDDGWQATGAVAPGDRVVVTGAALLASAQALASGPAGGQD